jgi:hypothetical protein
MQLCGRALNAVLPAVHQVRWLAGTTQAPIRRHRKGHTNDSNTFAYYRATVGHFISR